MERYFNSIERRLLSLFCCLCLFNVCHAQTFIPDKDGFVADPAFKKMIADRGYQLVYAFRIFKEKPLVMIATVIKNDKWLTINNSGKVILNEEDAGRSTGISGNTGMSGSSDQKPGHADLTGRDPFEQVVVNGKYGTANKKTGENGLLPVYDQLSFLQDRLVKIIVKNKAGLAYTNGKILKQPQYEELSAPLLSFEKQEIRYIEVKKDGKYGRLTPKGIDVLQPVYDQIVNCTDCNIAQNLLRIVKDKKWGISTNTGKVTLEPTYDNIWSLSGKGQLLSAIGKSPDIKYGMIDSAGKVLLTPIYNGLSYMRKGDFIRLKAGGPDKFMYGMANLHGNIILKPVYEEISDFNNGVGTVKQGGKYGVLNLNGVTVIPVIYDELFLDNKNIVFKKDNGWGRMSITGKAPGVLNYDRVQRSGNYLVVTLNNKSGLMDFSGKIIAPLKYDSFSNMVNVIRDGVGEGIIDGKTYRIDRYGNEYLSK